MERRTNRNILIKKVEKGVEIKITRLYNNITFTHFHIKYLVYILEVYTKKFTQVTSLHKIDIR